MVVMRKLLAAIRAALIEPSDDRTAVASMVIWSFVLVLDVANAAADITWEPQMLWVVNIFNLIFSAWMFACAVRGVRYRRWVRRIREDAERASIDFHTIVKGLVDQ